MIPPFGLGASLLGGKVLLIDGGGGGGPIWRLERFLERGAEMVTERERTGFMAVEGIELGVVARLASRARGTITVCDELCVVGSLVSVGSSSSSMESTRRALRLLAARLKSGESIPAGSFSCALCLFFSCLYT